jgi:hypothetical protein
MPRRADPVAGALRAAAALVAVVGIGVFVWAATHRSSPRPRASTGSTLAGSLAAAVGSADVVSPHCRHAGASWRCAVSDRSGSGAVLYTVTVNDRGCWTAHLVERHSVQPLSPIVRGCL